MAGDILFRARRRRPFAQISHAILRDEKVSLDAIGFVCVVMSLPPGWTFNKTWARDRFNVGREKLDRIIRELKCSGYAVIVQDRDPETGRMGRVTYVFSDEAGQFDEEDEEPQTEKPYSGDEPQTGKPLTGKPYSGKSAPTNIRELRNKDLKKKAKAEKRPTQRPSIPSAAQPVQPVQPVEISTQPQNPEPEQDANPAMRNRVGVLMRDLAASLRPNGQRRLAHA